jgi:hypothetical protein
MTTKICFKCNEEKPLTDYYKHPRMGDGHLNKCKLCTRKDTANDLVKKTSTPEGLEKERQRHREKYKRLGYKDKQKVWDSNRDWKQGSKYKGLRRKYNLPRSFELHHWNYNDEFIEDVFILNIKQHRQAHRFLTLDQKLKIFYSDSGLLLDTKEKHKEYLQSKNIQFVTD